MFVFGGRNLSHDVASLVNVFMLILLFTEEVKLLKVLLISPAAKNNIDPLMPPLGLLSIATYLEHYNHIVKIYESAVNRGSFANLLGKLRLILSGYPLFPEKLLMMPFICLKLPKLPG